MNLLWVVCVLKACDEIFGEPENFCAVFNGHALAFAFKTYFPTVTLLIYETLAIGMECKFFEHEVNLHF